MHITNFFNRFKPITIDSAIKYLRSKGHTVTRVSDSYASFFMQGTKVIVKIYQGMFVLMMPYKLDADTLLAELLLANNDIMDERYVIKTYIRTKPIIDDEGEPIDNTVDHNVLIFTYESLCNNYGEFVDQYEWAISALLEAIIRYREIYRSYEEQSSSIPSSMHRKIGFKTNN